LAFSQAITNPKIKQVRKVLGISKT
jgi:hypothetical protein